MGSLGQQAHCGGWEGQARLSARAPLHVVVNKVGAVALQWVALHPMCCWSDACVLEVRAPQLGSCQTTVHSQPQAGGLGCRRLGASASP